MPPGAFVALNAGKWYERLQQICAFNDFPSPLDEEKLPVGTGSNPVYLVNDCVIKFFAEGGLKASLYGLGTELEFYNLLHKLNSPLMNYIPPILASGILLFENGSYRVVPWDGRGIPEVISSSNIMSRKHKEIDYPFGVWGKKEFEYQIAGRPLNESGNCGKNSLIWPYIVTKRCRGKIFAELRETLSSEDTLNLASFLGEQLRILHLLPVPRPFADDSTPMVREDYIYPSHGNGFVKNATDMIDQPAELNLFISILTRKRRDVSRRLVEWGDPIPTKLIEKVDQYIPHDLTVFFGKLENDTEVCKSCTWIHSDVMDDNIYMTPSCLDSLSEGNVSDTGLEEGMRLRRSNNRNVQKHSWAPSHILDFSDLSVGEPILDIIPIYLDVFRGDSHLLKKFLDSYKLPFVRKESLMVVANNRYNQLSYRAMCYCLLHDENVLGAIFSLWKELRTATSWEEVEEKVWGDLNNYAVVS